MTPMRPRLAALTLLLCLVAAPASAQRPAPPPAPPAEAVADDGWMDAQLADLNHYAKRYPDSFADELVRYHNAPRELVTELLAQGWSPAEVYYACALGSATGQPCRAIAQERAAHRDEAWVVTAARMGMPGGADLQRRLHGQIVASYRRWGRPVLPEPPAAPAPETRQAPTSEGRLPASRGDG